MNIRIALAGNPNSGKTTLFNALTGSNQFVGNWPGVTVEKRKASLKNTIMLLLQTFPAFIPCRPIRWKRSLQENISLRNGPTLSSILSMAQTSSGIYI